MDNINAEIEFFENINSDFVETDIDFELGSWAEADLTSGAETNDD